MVTFAQLSFCDGSKGDPVFFENFGSGSDFGPQLPPGTTSYNFVATGPNDGSYTLSNNVGGTSGSWHTGPDHTPDSDPNGSNGKVLLVNASFTAGEFYRREVSGLCVNTTFEFSAWVMNVYNAGAGVCPGSGIPVDVTFEIWDATETTLLKSGSTGAIDGTNTPQWTQFGLIFTVLPGQTSIVLKMINNGQGGCGNDLAIDDILFRSCGDTTTLTSNGISGSTYTACSNETPVSVMIEIAINMANPHVFQWQSSADNSTWTDLAGETGMSYTTPPVTTDTHYRVKVAQDAANLANPYCYTVSDSFSIIIIPQPVAPVSNGDIEVCGNEPVPPLSVTVSGAGVSARWYDAPTGGNLLYEGLQFQSAAESTYFAEAYHTSSGCKSASRVLVRLTFLEAPVIPGDESESFVFCEGESATLDAGIGGVAYQWLPGGQTTRRVTIAQPGTYTLTVTNPSGCKDTKSFTLTAIPAPVISSVTNAGRTITVETAAAGDYEYAIGSSSYQDSNVFENAEGGMLTVYVREKNGCGIAQQDFFLLVVPTFFTPNEDGFNDYFRISGFLYIPGTVVQIFDRMGKLIYQLDHAHDSWDGKFNSHPLPTSDYWYRLLLPNGKTQTGHFSLLR